MKRIIGAGAAVWVLVAGAAAATADVASAKDAYLRGLEKLKTEDFEGAAQEFEASFDDVPRSSSLFNLAQCYFKLGRHMESLTAFLRLQSEFNESLSKDDLEQVGAKIKENRALLPSLLLVTLPEGATVTIDDKPAGTTPMDEPLYFATGDHFISVSKDGFETVRWSAAYNSGAREEKQITLKAIEAPPAPEPVVEPVSPESAEETTPVSQESTVKPKRKKFVPMYLAGLSGTILMAGVSTALWAATFHRNAEYEEKNDRLKNAEEWNDNLEKSRDDDRNASDNYNRAAVATTIITGAFAAVTVAAVILQSRENKETRISLRPGGVEVRF